MLRKTTIGAASEFQRRMGLTPGGAWHSIALLTWLLGLRVKRVAAIGNRKAFSQDELLTSDSVVSILEFEEQVLGVCKALLGVGVTPLAPRTIFLSVVGTHGAFLTGSDPENDSVRFQDEIASRVHLPIEGVPSWEEFDQSLFVSMVRDYLQAVDSGCEPEFSLKDALHVTAVSIAAFESSMQGGSWKEIHEWAES